MTTRLEIASLYSDRLLDAFPTLEQQVTEFLRKYTGVVATPETSGNLILEYSSALVDIGLSIAEGIKSGRLTKNELFEAAITPVRDAGKLDRVIEGKVGIVIHGEGKHRYHVLDKEQHPASTGRDLLFLLQRLPRGVDTQPEVHKTGGIEVYLPLVGGVTFYINRVEYQPEALSVLLIVLPGDVHHHVKNQGQGPARVLIIGGFGFGVGDKVPPGEIESLITKTRWPNVPRLISLD